MSSGEHRASAHPPVAGAGSELTARVLTRVADRLSALARAVRDPGVPRRAVRQDRPDGGPRHHSRAEALAIGLGCDSMRPYYGRRARR